MTMKAGTYYIGDLCYVMHKEWDEVCMFGTGWDIKDEATVGKDFVGTVQYPNGLVGHVFIDKCAG